MDDGLDSKVIKDMSYDYNTKVSNILDEIDEIKKEMIYNKVLILHLNERIHSLFVKLVPKMDKGEKKTQLKYKKVLSKINIGKTIKKDNGNGIVSVFVFSDKYHLYKDLLEKREIHLNKILERVGLTAKQETKKKKIR